MTESAKDEANIVEIMAKAYRECWRDKHELRAETLEWNDIEEEEFSECIAQMEAALTAIRAAGWVVVPVEPTRAMLMAGYDESGGRAVISIWEAMLETAPGAKP